MTINITMAVMLAGLYSIGFYLLMQRSLMRVILGIVILGHGANLFLQVAGGPPGEPTFVGTAAVEAMVDPLPQALALTAIVITFGLTTFLLALSYRSWALLGHDEVQDDVEDRRVAEAELAEREIEDEAAEAERVAGFEAPEAPEAGPGQTDEEAGVR
ncbi:multicomponent Na+:H+ antiporter subunit C [Prauserella aidingensis]|uniref:Na(+)/H(+) antiporter subunit C n=1 Tax=Prauserella aidingensis TaxID=387890 RepID=UPI0020A3639E|nr:Na(+)/H(+) antiporter subunit C [Prauserella aidingensis]MCP2253873.1 multicomponent Na+:H+ antiporter subunit C [Prauserella aidingensis]